MTTPSLTDRIDSLRRRISSLDTLIEREEGKAESSLSIAGRSLSRRTLEEMEGQRTRLMLRLRRLLRVKDGEDPYVLRRDAQQYRRGSRSTT